MRTADDLFLIALDDRTGRLRVEPGTLGLGLAGGLLAELVLAGAVVADGDRLRVRPRIVPPDAVGHGICELLTAEPQHPMPTWLRYLATDAVEKVIGRLTRDKIIIAERERGLVRRTTRYRPVDVTTVAWRPVRLTKLLDEQHITTWPDCVLACLAHAVGVTGFLLRDSADNTRRHLDQVATQLHQMPGLATVVAAVATATGTHVTTPHR